MIEINSKLTLITGLHIGEADDGMKIGGVDSPVITREVFADRESGELGFPQYDKNDKDKIINGLKKIREPYIPGSSLKGKIRSLLEHYFELIDYSEKDKKKRGRVVDSSLKKKDDFKDKKEYIDLIIKLFGESAGNEGIDGINITRVIFRDCFITKNVRKAYLNDKMEILETKYENVIDRVTGTTIKGGLRQIQRVPSAVEFDFNMSIRVFEGDKLELLKDTIFLGLKLLELDTLGGSGSRGYGRVKFNNISGDIAKLRKSIDDELNKS